LPNIFADIVALDSVNNVFLVNSSSERENVIVLERTQSHTRSRDSQRVNLLPLIFLNVIDLTKPIDLAVNESAHNIDEPLDSAQRVVGMREDHRWFLIHIGEDLVVSVALFEVLVFSFVATADQVDAAIFGGDRSWVKRHFELHRNRPLLELRVVDFEDISVLLVPLERMDSARDAWVEWVFDIVINSQIWLNEVWEVNDDLISVLVHEPLELRDILKLVEVFFKLCVQI